MSGPDAIGGTVATASTAPPREKLKAAAQAFEAVFIRQIMTSMRAASLGDDIMGSDAGDQFRDMSDARTADDMAAKGTFGIADLLLAQLGKTVTGPAETNAAAETKKE